MWRRLDRQVQNRGILMGRETVNAELAHNMRMTSNTDSRIPQRIRHELRFRKLQVLQRQSVTPHLIRITLGGTDLQGFTSLGFDDHCKLFFPDPQTGELPLPRVAPDGVAWPDGPRPAARDYTPLHFDSQAQTLEFDFVLHEAGPATAWAQSAQAGDWLGVGGPRGSFVVPLAFDWHLLAGDATALPAISRRLRELPADARAVAVIEVDSEQDQLPLASDARVEIHWAHRQGGSQPEAASPLLQKLQTLDFPAGDYFGWVATESADAKAIRQYLLQARGANPKWLRASGYWKRGKPATHETFDE